MACRASAWSISRPSTGSGRGLVGEGAFVEAHDPHRDPNPRARRRGSRRSPPNRTSPSRPIDYLVRGGRRVRLCLGRLEPQILHRRRRSRRHLSAPRRRPASGTPRRATPSCSPPAAASTGPTARRLAYGKTAFLNRGFGATAGWSAPPIAPFLELVRRLGFLGQALRRRTPRRLASADIAPIRLNPLPNWSAAHSAQPFDLASKRRDALADPAQLHFQPRRAIFQAGDQKLRFGKGLVASRKARLEIGHVGEDFHKNRLTHPS